MENLLVMLEEELNYSKKQSKSRINALMREAGQARAQVSNELYYAKEHNRICLSLSMSQGNEHVEKRKKTLWQLPPISLDVSNTERQFSETEEAKRMIVHEQLKAMERYGYCSAVI